MRLLSLLVVALTFGCATPVQESKAPEVSKPVAKPAVKANRAPVALKIDYRPDTPNRVARVVFDVPVTDESAGIMVEIIEVANEAGLDAVVIEFDTPGGSVDAGIKLGKAIEQSKTDVICIVDGMAASMGMYLLQSCHERIMTPRSLLMAHQPWMMGMGGERDFDNGSKMLSALGKALSEHICAKVKLPQAECKAKFDNGKEWWLTHQEALQVGAVDLVVASVPDTVVCLRESAGCPTAKGPLKVQRKT